MTEQHMPARIWVEDTRDYGSWFDHPNETHPVKYIRADIAERMAEALERCAEARMPGEARRIAREALSEFKAASHV